MPVLGEILGWEILVPLALIALLFGSAKIPQLARSLGQAQQEFRKGAEGAPDPAEPKAEAEAHDEGRTP